MNATLKQAKKTLELIDQSGKDAEQLQKLFPYFSVLLRANVDEMNLDDFCKICGRKSAREKKAKLECSLLGFVGTWPIFETHEQFVPKEKFVVNTSYSAPVKIYLRGSNFDEWFLDKIEEPIKRGALCIHILKGTSVDPLIIVKRGGEAKVESFLTEVYQLMEQQGNGQSGILLNSGQPNIFYVRDKRSVLRAVRVSWLAGGWLVDADSFERLGTRSDGIQVFSHNS